MRALVAMTMTVSTLVIAGCGETAATGTTENAVSPATSESASSPQSESPPPPEEKSEPEANPESSPEPENKPEPESPEPEKKSEGKKEEPGSLSHAEDAQFCSEHECIANFENGHGEVVECSDGEWSHSGSISGACSDHGGEAH
jgi:hypothetical protein